MKKLKPFLVPVFSVIVGATLAVAILAWKPNLLSKIATVSDPNPRTEQEFFDDVTQQQRKLFKDFDDVFDKDFFAHQDPFDEMKKMRERMKKHFGESEKDSLWSNPFDSWFQNRFGGGSVEDISKREDQDFVYYDIKVEDIKGTSIQTKVENGYLTISGEIKKEASSGQNDSDSGQMKQSFSSSFQRTFPLPENVDSNRMETNHEDNKVVIKFPKLKS